jgi:predicted nucleotidyltransferase component of viral defense system
MSTERKNLPASIHQRLLNKARQSGRAFNELLQYYAIERLLYRLSISEYSELFTLKGALMFNAWGLTNLRPTRDIDLLGHTQNTVDAVLKIFQDLSKLEADPDGLEFDPVHIRSERIKEDAEYEGIRITMTARLGKTRLTIQIDIGFADVITPAPERLDYPTILDFPVPHLYGYPPETVIAEKFQAMTVLGMANSRMKDFYDIWMLITNFEFDGRVIQTAIERTFQNRSTELPDERHIVFSKEFAENKRDQWNAFSKRLRDENMIVMDQIIATMRSFFFPVLHASEQGTVFKKKWKTKWR